MSQLGHEQPVRSGSVITTPRRCAGRGGHQNRHCETRAAVWSRFRQLRSSQQEALPMPASGHNRPTCSSLVCLLPPGADMVRKRAPEEPSGWTPAPASAYGPACDFEPHPSHLPVPDRGVRYPLGPPGRIFNQSLYMLVRDEMLVAQTGTVPRTRIKNYANRQQRSVECTRRLCLRISS
jgi:hypothetical protein